MLLNTSLQQQKLESLLPNVSKTKNPINDDPSIGFEKMGPNNSHIRIKEILRSNQNLARERG